MLKRVMGKASFATMQDMSGRIQLYVTNDGVGEDVHDAFKHWDLGDIVGADGTLFRTRTGELTVKCDGAPPAVQGAAPAAREVPRSGRPGNKYRFRYLDLITNESSRDLHRAQPHDERCAPK
jgi:lysyl-tRNA synthetase class 2